VFKYPQKRYKTSKMIRFFSEENELLSDGSDDFVGNNLESIESDGLGDGLALSGNEDITFSDSEARRNVDSDVSVSLLVSVVLSDVVEIILSDNDGLVHLGGNNQSPKRQKRIKIRYDNILFRRHSFHFFSKIFFY